MTHSTDFQPDRPLLALGLRLISVTCFSAMSAFIKLATDKGAALPEIMTWRQAFALPIVLLILWRGPGFSILRTQRFGAHIRRSAIGLVCMLLTFAAVSRLQLAEATTLSFLTPVFATLISVMLFGEKVGFRRWAAILIGFLGVLIVAQPGRSTIEPIGLAAGLIGALMVALVSFQIRDLAKTDQPMSVVFWFTALSTLVLLPLWPITCKDHDLATWGMLFAIGTIGGIAQVAMTYSLRFGPVSKVVAMDYIALIWATLADGLLWDSLPKPTTWVGSAIIIASSFYIIWREHRLSLQRNREISA